jgi:hypothetical protein
MSISRLSSHSRYWYEILPLLKKLDYIKKFRAREKVAFSIHHFVGTTVAIMSLWEIPV